MRSKSIDKDAFKGLEKINNLWFDNNKLSFLPENLLSGIFVNNFRIDNNKFSCLGDNLEKIFVAATTNIEGNPWDCECFKNIDLWVSKHGKDVIRYYSTMVCDGKWINCKLRKKKE